MSINLKDQFNSLNTNLQTEENA